MGKTFYSVVYKVQGADTLWTAWFDDEDKARDFISTELFLSDQVPAVCTLEDPAEIEEACKKVTYWSLWTRDFRDARTEAAAQIADRYLEFLRTAAPEMLAHPLDDDYATDDRGVVADTILALLGSSDAIVKMINDIVERQTARYEERKNKRHPDEQADAEKVVDYIKSAADGLLNDICQFGKA